MASLPIDRRLDLDAVDPGTELVARLHDILDLVCRLVGDRVGLTAILLDHLFGVFERLVGFLLSEAEPWPAMSCCPA
jgi:hypothetical protein